MLWTTVCSTGSQGLKKCTGAQKSKGQERMRSTLERCVRRGKMHSYQAGPVPSADSS